MASNIKLSTIGASAGLNTSTTTVSGSYVATQFLTGSVGAGVRDLPNTPGTLSGTSARPYGQQYEFIEFDGKLPIISIDTLTSPDTATLNSGKRLNFTYSLSGIRAGEEGRIYIWINGVNTGEYYFINSASNGTGISNYYLDVLNTYVVPNSINTLQLVLTITGTSKTANDSKTVYVYPLDLTIQSISQTPSLTGAGSYNYTTGSISFNATVAGGVSPYIYNWNTGVSSTNPYSFDNASTITDKQITLVVTDSHTPTADTANGTSLPIMRRPISVSISNASISEPYVQYGLTSTVNYNVEPAAITYSWELASGAGFMANSGTTSANPLVYYTTLGPRTHKLSITGTNNGSIRNNTTSNTTVQVSPTANVSVTYVTSSEVWNATFDSVIDATYGTRTYEYQGRSKDAGGSYTDWGNSVSISTNSIVNQAFAGKTNTAQYIQIRVRVRRTFSTFNEVSSWVESNEALVPIKGIIVASDQTNILTGGNRTFTGTVTLNGAADNGFTSPTISNNSGSFTGATISNAAAFTSAISKNSGTTNVFTITVNNNCSRNDYGKIWHTVGCSDGNGYVLTKQITTQYKISSTSINFRIEWQNAQYYNNAYTAFYADLNYPNFTYSNFKYKTSLGGTYTALNGGDFYGSYLHAFSAPTANQTWYAQIQAAGGVYTTSDLTEVSGIIWGYPNQSYGYSLIHVDGNGTETNSGFPSTSSNMRLRVKRTGGGSIGFAGISAVFDVDLSFFQSIAASAIADDASFFQTNTFNYYDGSVCSATSKYSRVILSYAIPDSGGKNYLHFIDQYFYLLNQPGGISITQGTGFADTGIAIRDVPFNFHITYTTWGPPFTNPYLGNYYVYIGDTSMTDIFNRYDEYYDLVNYFPLYPDASSQSTFCRYFYTPFGGLTKAGRSRGNTYSATIWGNEYQVTQAGTPPFNLIYNLTKNLSSEIGQAVSISIYGRRLASVTAPTITRTKGTSTVNITVNGSGTGADGAVDVSLDGITRTNQYSSNNSTWTNFVGNSVSTGLAFGTTVYVRQSWYHNDWGNTINSSASSIVLEDIDWELELVNLNNVSLPIRSGIGNNVIFSPGNLFTLSTDSAVAAVTGVQLSSFYSTYFLTVRGLDTDPEMTGAYLTADGASIYRVYRYAPGNYWIGSANASYSDIKNTSTWPPGAIATGAIVVAFSAPGTYSTEKLITITAQKSSTDTKGQIKYYYKVRTRNEANDINFAITTYGCDSVTLTAYLGQLDTANIMYIQKSTNGGTSWTTIFTEDYIDANTNYTYDVGSLTGTTFFRALLYEGTTLKKESNSDSHQKIVPVGDGTVHFTGINSFCTFLSYRVDRNVNANSGTDNRYSIRFYWGDEYGNTTTLAFPTQPLTGKYFNTDYNVAEGLSLQSLPCDVQLYAEVTPYSVTNCVGNPFYGGGIIVKSVNTAACQCLIDGCLVYGTLVEMGDGTFKKVEDLEIGEVVRSLSIKDLDVNIEDNWKDFYTADFEYENGLSVITGIDDRGFNQYYIINNNLKLTYEHPVFIKRAEVCMFTQTSGLVLGDYIFKDNGEFEIISSIDIIDEYVQTINIDIEENDVYFANGILVHNRAGDKA